MGTAIQENQAWQAVWADPAGPNNDTHFPRDLSVQFVDFAGKREEEWLDGSTSSQYLKSVLMNGGPDGFELIGLDNRYELSVQKEVTTTLSGLQKLGWPWTPWPWSDNSAYQVSEFKFAYLINIVVCGLTCVGDACHSVPVQLPTCCVLGMFCICGIASGGIESHNQALDLCAANTLWGTIVGVLDQWCQSKELHVHGISGR